MDKQKYLIRNIKNFIANLMKDFKIERIVFFGSGVTKKFTSHSDIDLIIVSDNFKGMNFFERAAKMYDYWDIDLPVDFLCYTLEEFEKLRKKISIVREALQNGVIVR